jgi:hypothetical protein
MGGVRQAEEGLVMLKLLWFFIFSLWLSTAFFIYNCAELFGVNL